MAKKEEKKSSGKKSILIVILIPIMIVVLIAGVFFAIIDGLIKIIEKVVNAIINFLKNPSLYLEMLGGWMENVWNDLWDIGDFDPRNYAQYRKNPSIVIDTANFTTMKEQLENVINREAAGLDDLTLKKMLLCYYKNIYLKDTTILIELTEQECLDNGIDYEELSTYTKGLTSDSKYKEVKDDDFDPFTVISGTKDGGIGETGHVYLKTNGIISIRNEKQQKEDILYYYTEEGLKKIYKEYTDQLNEKKQEYANAIKRYLKNCYTYSNGQMKMYAFTEESETKKYTYTPEGKDEPEITEDSKTNGTEKNTASLVTVDYTIDIEQFSTPVEFLIDLMEITGSRDFIEAFMRLLDEQESIKLTLYEIAQTTKTTTEKKYTQKTIATGESNSDYMVKTRDGETLESYYAYDDRYKRTNKSFC